jgi:hypothetical protein
MRLLTHGAVREILAAVKPLAEYYQLTGKPLGLTAEVAEYVAAEILGLELVRPRTRGYDAIRQMSAGAVQRIRIKGRAYGENAKRSQRLGIIKAGCTQRRGAARAPRQSHTGAPRSVGSVEERLAVPGSKARERGALGIGEFKRLARRIWPRPSVDA